MITCTKPMKRDPGQYEGKCSYCTSLYEADQDDMIQVGDGRNGVMIKQSDCTVCGKSSTVSWKCVKKLTFSECERDLVGTSDDLRKSPRQEHVNTDDGPMGLSRAYNGGR